MRVPLSIGAALLGLLLLCGGAAAQRLPFRQLAVRDGLLSNFVISLAQDRDGRLWVGTTDGITMFDGVDCQSLTKNDGLPSHYILRMRQAGDAAGGMLVITPRGMVRVRQGRVSPCLRETDGARIFISDITTLADGRLAASGPDGLYLLRDTLLVPHVRDTRLAHATRLHAAADGMIWILGEHGVATWNPATRVYRVIDSSESIYRETYALRETGESIHVCARDSSVVEFRDGALYRRHRIPGARPVDLIRDDEGNWWIATTKGLLVTKGASFGEGGFNRVEIAVDVPFPEINVLLIDREKNLWYASAGEGAGWLEERSALSFRCEDMTGLGTTDDRGGIWLSSRLGIRECRRDAGGAWHMALHASASDWPRGYSYHLQASGGLLYASFAFHDLAVFDIRGASANGTAPRLLRRLLPSRAVPNPDGFCFLVDRRDRLWAKTRDGDVAVVDASRPDRLLRLLRRPHPDIRSMFEDRDGSVWIGGYGGRPVRLAGPDPLRASPQAPDGIGPLDVRAFLRDRRGTLWLGTLQGVFRHADGRWDSLTVRNGLSSERTGALAEDGRGRIWLGTQRGPLTLEPSTRNVDEHIELTAHPVVGLGVLGGGGHELLWIAGTTGLTLLDLRGGIPDTLPPRAFLRAMYVNERPVAEGTMVFGVSENNFRFEFSVPHLRRARGVRLQYQFAGIDTGWSAPTADRTLVLRSLPPGDYTLLVRARNSLGIAGAPPLRLRFEILPPLWRRWWFLLGAVVLLAAAVAFVVRMRVRRLLETERMRARIAADLHDDIGAGLTRIAMMTDMLRQQADIARRDAGAGSEHATQSFATLQSTLARAGATARELIDHMSDVVWSLDPRNDSIAQLADRLRVFAHDLCEAPDIALRFDIDDSVLAVRGSSDMNRNLLMVMKEALHNAVRHGAPRTIEVALSVRDGHVSFLVRDDGSGFDPGAVARRSGLQHMLDRVRGFGGTLRVDATPEQGTSVSGTIPLTRKN